MLTRAKKRRGFTLPEVLVAVGIIAFLAAVTVPAIKSRIQEGYEDAIIQEFQTLSSAILAYKQDVGRYPYTLNYLIALPAGAKDYCNNTLSSNDSAKWNGPYISRTWVTTLGQYPIAGRDYVQDVIYLNKNLYPGSNGLYIQINMYDATAAADIDLKIDGVAGNSTGIIRYTNSTPAQVYWYIPTKSSAC